MYRIPMLLAGTVTNNNIDLKKKIVLEIKNMLLPKKYRTTTFVTLLTLMGSVSG
jgi:hypothetical protein